MPDAIRRSLFWSAIAYGVFGLAVGLLRWQGEATGNALVTLVFFGGSGLALTAWITAGVFFFTAVWHRIDQRVPQSSATSTVFAGLAWCGFVAMIFSLYLRP